jgi:hypothetical protein
VTYQYSTTSAGAVIATAKIRGQIRTVGRATSHNHRFELKVTLKHLHRERYRLTLLELKTHGKSVVIGHTTLTVS